MARLVIMDRQLNQKHIAITDNIPDAIDIVSPQKTNFELMLNKNINVGDLVYVSKDNKADYIGIVDEVVNENSTKIYTFPLISITDTECMLNNINGDVFSWINSTLTTNFISSNDNLFNLPLEIENHILTPVSLEYSFSSNNLFDALLQIFKKTGVYLEFDITFTENGRPEAILCKVFNSKEQDVIRIKYNNPLMITEPVYDFTYNGVNKVIFIPQGSGNTYALYLLKDNTITSNPNANNRITPIVQQIVEYDETSPTFSSDIQQKAFEILSGNVVEYNIQLQVKSNINYPFKVFKRVDLIAEDETYESYVTKIVNHNDEYYDIVLGVVRNTLTDKLKQLKNSKTSTGSRSGGGGSTVPVVDDLISTSTTSALSANQGRVLKGYTDNAFTQVSINNTTGIFTFTKQNGTTVQVDTMLEKVVVNFDYDSTTQELVLTLEDGTTKRIPISSFINTYTGVDGAEITVSVSNNQISAVLKDGSVTPIKLSSNLRNAIDNKLNRTATENQIVVGGVSHKYTTELELSGQKLKQTFLDENYYTEEVLKNLQLDISPDGLTLTDLTTNNLVRPTINNQSVAYLSDIPPSSGASVTFRKWSSTTSGGSSSGGSTGGLS